MITFKKDYIICYNDKIYKSFNSWQQACEFVHVTYDSFNSNEPLSNHRMRKLKKKIKDSIKDSRTYCGLKWEENAKRNKYDKYERSIR